MILTKEAIENRIKELDSAIIQQGQYAQQMNNQILMFHGAKEEYNVMLGQIAAQERLEAEKKDAEEAANQENPAVPEDQCGETKDENSEL